MGPAQCLESLNGWIKNVQPRDELERTFIRLIEHFVQEIDQVRRCRDAWRSKSVRQAPDREEYEAHVLGHRLTLAIRPPWVGRDAWSSQWRKSHSGQANGAWDDPASLVKQLEATAAGCRWLLDRWKEIHACFQPGKNWIAEDSLTVIGLMGRRPLEALHDPEVAEVFLASHAFDRRGRRDFKELWRELGFGVAKDFLARLRTSARSANNRYDAEQGWQAIIAIVERATERLKAKEHEHQQHADRPETLAATARAFDATPYAAKLNRWEQECCAGRGTRARHIEEAPAVGRAATKSVARRQTGSAVRDQGRESQKSWGEKGDEPCCDRSSEAGSRPESHTCCRSALAHRRACEFFPCPGRPASCPGASASLAGRSRDFLTATVPIFPASHIEFFVPLWTCVKWLRL